jgi:hypothetical protein
MKTRTDLLNHLATKYHLKRYFEIGVQNPQQNFDKILCEYKVGVDPDPNAHASFCMTSDEFFDAIDYSLKVNYDLIFIDGLHTAEQVEKDFENALRIISPNGFIVLHDCNPEKEEHTIIPRPTKIGHWNGDVFKFAVMISNSRKITVDIDNGCAIIKNNDKFMYESDRFTGDLSCSFEHFNKNRKQLLNLITWDEFINQP